MKNFAAHNQELLKSAPFDVLAKDVDVTTKEIELPEVPGHKFLIRIYRPKDITGPLPVMLYFHGGFWCSGDSYAEDFGSRAIITRGAPIIVASFETRRVPEAKWNEVFSDAENAMKWMSKNAKSIGADTSKGFLVGGATGGAHLAAICAIRARNRHPDIKLTGQILIVPTFIVYPDPQIPADLKKRLGSHEEVKNPEGFFDENTLELYFKTLGVPESEQRKGENFPLWEKDLSGLPPVYLPMDEHDPTRDDGFAYAELCREAGVLTRTDYYEGLPNMFVYFAELSTTLTAGFHLSGAVKWLLQERK